MCFCGLAVIHQGEVEDDYREFQDDELESIAADDSIPFAASEAEALLEMMAEYAEYHE
jgi:hypothetical protein